MCSFQGTIDFPFPFRFRSNLSFRFPFVPLPAGFLFLSQFPVPFFSNPMGLSWPFPSNSRLCFTVSGFFKPYGLKWTRTTDLTLIRRAL